MKILKFLPYFPPHKGGLETHVQEWNRWWVKKGYGEVLNLVFSVGQPEVFEYSENGYRVIVVPAFEVVPNFPFPKFWMADFWRGLKEAKKFKADIINTHTRFFISSFLGGLFSKYHKIPWIHLEHGSDYVKLESHFKTFIAWLFDQIIGRWIFCFADEVIPISGACKSFIERFTSRKMQIFYRGLDVVDKGIEKNSSDIKDRFPGKIVVGFIGRLFKWKNVESFIRAYYLLDEKIQNKLQPVIIGYGEDLERLKSIDIEHKFYFTGGKNASVDIATQSDFDIHLHSSSPGGGLATTLLQAMYLGCFIVATPYEGANEVITMGKNGILLPSDSVEEIMNGILTALNELETKKEEYMKINAEMIKNNFSWSANIDKYHLYFTQFLKTGKKS